jgi:hypothetical protein
MAEGGGGGGRLLRSQGNIRQFFALSSQHPLSEPPAINGLMNFLYRFTITTSEDVFSGIICKFSAPPAPKYMSTAL